MLLDTVQGQCRLGEFASYKGALWALAASAIPSFRTSHSNPQPQRPILPAYQPGATEIFQLYRPPLAPLQDSATTYTRAHDNFTGEACSTTIFNHEFVNSYGQPAVADYIAPPPSCIWNTVYFHLHTTSRGTQYDRLAFIFLDDTELWRTSTAEPSYNGIYFTYTKDLTHFNSILKQNGTIIMDMGNMVTGGLTGKFNVTLSAHYFNLDISPDQKPADVILPVSSMHSGQGQPSHFTLPNDNAKTTLSVPKNVKKAVISIIASGNWAEEFWYTNVPDTLTKEFPGAGLAGHSSYREIQLFVDGVMVEAIMPVPAIYTGGINPGLWKPVVHPLAYDLWETEVDITPWVAGKSKVIIELKMEGLRSINGGEGLEIGGEIGQNWYVSGRTFIWTDPIAESVDPSLYTLYVQPPSVEYSYAINGNGSDKAVSFTTSVIRKTEVSRQYGYRKLKWARSQRYTIESTIFAGGSNQTLSTNTTVSETLWEFNPREALHVPLYNSDLHLSVDSAFIRYPDRSFLLYGAVDNKYARNGEESVLLTDKSPLRLEKLSNEPFGLAKSTSLWSIDDESTYFAASAQSQKRSWLTSKDFQHIDYNIHSDAYTHDRTVKTYERDVKSNFTHVVNDSEKINGKGSSSFDVQRILDPEDMRRLEEEILENMFGPEPCPGRFQANRHKYPCDDFPSGLDYHPPYNKYISDHNV